MAKKSRREPKRPEGPAKPLAHNPFAALGAITGPPGPKSEPAAASSEPSAKAPAPAFGPKVVVRREKKGRGGKTVTRVSGVGAPAEVLTRMKKALGCGGTVEGDDLILLGDVGDRATTWLEREGARRVVRGS